MQSRRKLLTLIVGLVFVVPLPAFQGSKGKDPVNKTSGGAALKGFDAVAYFEEGRAVKGSQEFQLEWTGARWRFASAAHRDLFAADPMKYAPQYGGYCAYGVSRGYFADIDPTVWKIVNTKLYLNYDAKVGQTWSKDPAGFIAKADENWPKLIKK